MRATIRAEVAVDKRHDGTCQVYISRVLVVIFRQPATQYQLSRRFDFVHSAELGGAGGVVEQVGLGLGFFCDLDQRVGEGIEGVFVLGFGRLDHQLSRRFHANSGIASLLS